MSKSRLKILETLLGPQNRWPTFTPEQVEWLEKVWPPRVIKRGETIEDHLRYAGAADVVSLIRMRVADGSGATDELTQDELEELEIVAAGSAAAHGEG